MIKSLLLYSAWLLVSFTALAQQSVYDFDIKHWTSADGLSANPVKTISQDDTGYIWFGTFYGLNRFDGQQFEHFTTDNTRHLASNVITRLLKDSSGYMWVGTKAGLSGFNPATLQFERFAILSEVTSILEVSPGEIWVAAGNLFRIQHGMISRVDQIKAQVNELEVSPEGIWVGSTEQVFLLQPDGGITPFPLPVQLAQSPIYDFHYSGGDLLIGSEAGYFRLSPDGNIARQPLPDQSHTPVYKVFIDRYNSKWISAHRKLFHQSGDRQWQQITVDELGSYPWFSSIFEDKDRNLWMGSLSEGVYRISRGNIQRVVPENIDPVIRSVAVTPQHNLWLATQSEIGQLTADGHFELLVSTAGSGIGAVHDVIWPEPDLMLLATDNGVWQYRTGDQSLQPVLSPLKGYPVRVLQPAESGAIWVGGVSGLYLYHTGQLTPFAYNHELESRHITDLQQQDDMLLFGTTRGVYQYRQQKLQRLGAGSALYNSYITSLLLLPDQTMLVGTLDDGIFARFSDGSWHQLYAGNGLPHGTVVSLTYHHNTDEVWASSNKGIFRFRLADLPQVLDNHLQVDEVLTPYDRQLGTLPGRCCNGAGQSKVALWQQQYWYPTLKGIVAVPAELGNEASHVLLPLIKHVSGLHDYVLPTKEKAIVLEEGDRNLTIRYSALEFAKPESLQFRYLLEGFDQEWQQAGSRREAIYTNLSPGIFTFHLQVKTAHEAWSPQQKIALTIKVPKRFDETILYRSLWLLLVLFGLYGIFWLVRRNAIYKQEQLELLVRQRTQELENSNQRLNELNEQLVHLTHKDQLTGLRNRRFMFEQLPKDVEHFQHNRILMQEQGKCIALVHLTLDNFKTVNDKYGISAGDSLIQQLSGMLIRETRGSDYVVRFAGKEFVVVLRDIEAISVKPFCHQLHEQIGKTPFTLPDGDRMRLSCSMGYSVYPLPLLGGQLISWEISLQLAEMALLQLKRNHQSGVASIMFHQQVDAFEFEDSAHIEEQVEKLLSEGLAWYDI